MQIMQWKKFQVHVDKKGALFNNWEMELDSGLGRQS